MSKRMHITVVFRKVPVGKFNQVSSLRPSLYPGRTAALPKARKKKTPRSALSVMPVTWPRSSLETQSTRELIPGYS